jgi:hypothetical protein
MKEIIVNAFPKSGVTWLLHLVCDLLEAQHQDTPQMEPLSYGHPVSGEWVVRKTHYPYWEQAIPHLKGKVVIFTQRDPRDVVVSAMFYRKTTDLDEAIDVMIKSKYVDYLESWLKPVEPLKVAQVIYTRYEWLHQGPGELARIFVSLTKTSLEGGGLIPDEVIKRTQVALDRQSFPNMVKQLGDRHFMRKGIVGDWRNHFNRDQAQRFNDHFGQFMLEQGYVDDLEWWKDV